MYVSELCKNLFFHAQINFSVLARSWKLIFPLQSKSWSFPRLWFLYFNEQRWINKLENTRTNTSVPSRLWCAFCFAHFIVIIMFYISAMCCLHKPRFLYFHLKCLASLWLKEKNFHLHYSPPQWNAAIVHLPVCLFYLSVSKISHVLEDTFYFNSQNIITGCTSTVIYRIDDNFWHQTNAR